MDRQQFLARVRQALDVTDNCPQQSSLVLRWGQLSAKFIEHAKLIGDNMTPATRSCYEHLLTCV